MKKSPGRVKDERQLIREAREFIPAHGGLSLEQAQQLAIDAIEGNGGNCRCCGQYMQLYRTVFNNNLARCLRAFYELDCEKRAKWLRINGARIRQGKAPLEEYTGWIHVAQITRTKRELGLGIFHYSALARWAVIQSRSPKSGYWRMTQIGFDFISGAIEIPAGCYTYDNNVLGFTKRMLDFETALGLPYSLPLGLEIAIQNADPQWG